MAFQGTPNTPGQYYQTGTPYGDYQFITLNEVINQFMIAYVGEDKLFPRLKRRDVVFHAQRQLQEFSFDTLKNFKDIEFSLDGRLSFPVPHDYVSHTHISWVDSSGVKHPIMPTSATSNPFNPNQSPTGSQNEVNDPSTGFYYNSTNDELFATNQVGPDNQSQTNYNWTNDNDAHMASHDYFDNDIKDIDGGRYGIDPQYQNINGTYFIDESKGIIHFSSDLADATIIIDYISDGLSQVNLDQPGNTGSTSNAMRVHKFAEEAMYLNIAYALVRSMSNQPEYLVNRFRRDAKASKRQAKLRLSNINIQEITQILRGKSKPIKL